MRRFKAAILGGSGFAGAELLRRLLRHPEVEVVRVCAADHVGRPVSAAHPNLEGLTDLCFENLPPEAAVAGVDVVLMGLPHDVSLQVVAAAAPRTRIIDMSGAFRLQNSRDYERFYGAPHAAPELLPSFVYGLPELNRDRLRGAERVASPGCFATSVELALLPLARAGLLRGAVDVVGVTGSSGSGAAPSVTTHHPTRAVNLRTYKPLVHQHVPEIEATLTSAGARNFTLNFVPISAPLSRGIFTTCFVRLDQAESEAAIRGAYAEFYASARFVRVPAARLPEVIAVSGSNYAEVGFAVSDGSSGPRTLAAFCALDNLVKGGAGQAIQNLNLMLGLEESLCLEDPGGFP